MIKQLTYHTPEVFTQQYARYFLSSVESMFGFSGKNVPNFFFDLSKTKTINILGLLLIYKFLEYTVEHKCFKNPVCNLRECHYVSKELERYGFKKLVYAFINDDIPNYDLKFKEEDEFFIAPIVLDRGADFCSVEGQYAAKINRFYSYDSKASFVSLQCLGELSSNFIAHAKNDTKSVLAARGNREYVELACADTGVGIISNLKPLFSATSSNYQILSKSLEKGVTSKLNSAHMGYGLWLINEFVTIGKGELAVFSEGAYYINAGGKIKLGQCAHWKGTIIYIKITMKDTKVYSEVLKKLEPEVDDINLQRV